MHGVPPQCVGLESPRPRPQPARDLRQGGWLSSKAKRSPQNAPAGPHLPAPARVFSLPSGGAATAGLQTSRTGPSIHTACHRDVTHELLSLVKFSVKLGFPGERPSCKRRTDFQLARSSWDPCLALLGTGEPPSHPEGHTP